MDEAAGVKGGVVSVNTFKIFILKEGLLLTRQLLDPRLVVCA